MALASGRTAARVAALLAAALSLAGPQAIEPPQPEPAPQKPAPRFVPKFRPQNPNVLIDMPGAREQRERLESALNQGLAAVRVSEAVQALVARLSDPAFAERQKACEALLSPAIADAEIWALLDRGALDDEAHERLLRVAVRRVLEKPRGALGVRMGNAPAEHPGVLVQQTLPGLPADGVLKPGDVIETVDGRAVRNTLDLVDGLQTKVPGTEVAVTVLRTERDAQARPVVGPDGKPVTRRIDFRLPLGNANDLDRFDPAGGRAAPGLGNMNMALEQRREQAALLQRRFERALPEWVAVPAVVEPVDEPNFAPR